MHDPHLFRLASVGRILMVCLTIALLFGGTASAQYPAYEFANKLEGGTDGLNDLLSAVDNSGNIYLCGVFAGTQDFDPGSGTANLTAGSSNGDSFLAKYNSSGAFVWVFSIGSGGGVERPRGLALDGSGNVVVSGDFTFTGSGNDFDPGSGTSRLKGNRFIAKYTPAGAHVWSFALNSDDGQQTIELGNHYVTIDGSNNIYATYLLNGTVDFNPGKQTNNLSGNHEVVIAKYNSSGAFQWAKKFIGPGAYDWSRHAFTRVDGSGNIFIAGRFSGTCDFDPSSSTANLRAQHTASGGGDMFVAKYNSSGAYQWALRAGSTRPCSARSMAIDTSGNVVVTGSFRGVVDFDPSSGTATLTTDTSGTWNAAFVAKYSSSGGYVTSFQIGGESEQNVSGMHIAVDASNNMYVGGVYGGTVDFDPGSSSAELSSLSSYPNGGDCFVAKYSATGEYQWAFGLGGTKSDIPHFLNLSGTNVMVGGLFNNTVDFDPGSNTANLTASSGGSYFFARYSQSSALPKEAVQEETAEEADLGLRVVPNPFSDNFSLQLTGSGNAPMLMELVDITGTTVESQNVSADGTQHFGSHLPVGTYFLRVTRAGTSRQMVVQKLR